MNIKNLILLFLIFTFAKISTVLAMEVPRSIIFDLIDKHDPEGVKKLINTTGFDVNIQDTLGFKNTPLIAATLGFIKMTNILKKFDKGPEGFWKVAYENMIINLLRAGADIEKPNSASISFASIKKVNPEINAIHEKFLNQQKTKKT